MPVYTVTIPTPGTTINRQLMHNVVENLLSNLGVDNEDILYLGAAYDNASQPNATAGEKREVSFGTKERTFIEVEERRLDDGGFSRAVGYDLEAPLFHDKRYGIKISPNYVMYEASITIKRRAPARSMLGGWTNELQRKIDMGMDTFVTEGNFHYRIPIPTLNLLAACHRTISYNLTEPETLTAFLKRGFHQGVTIASNEVGGSLVYISRTAITRVQGSIDNSSVNKTIDGDAGAWFSQFTYTFQFARPESIVMAYPVMFNNRLIDSEWWYETNAPGVSNEAYASKGVAVAMQDTISALPETIALPIFLPDCDRRRPTHISRRAGEVDLFVGYLEFERDEFDAASHFIFNLKELGDVGFMYSQLTYLRHVGNNDPYMVESMIKVNIFKNGNIYDKGHVAIDGNLDVWLLGTIELSAKYQFNITMDTSLELKGVNGLNLMADVPTFIGGIILEFHPNLVPKYEMYIRGIPRPPSPESPDLAEYPYNIKDPIPATWIDPIQDWRVDKEPTFVSYPQYPDKPQLPSVHPSHEDKPFVESIPDDVIDGIVTETITSTKDARSNNRNDTLSIYQLNVFDGNIIACRKE